MTKPEFIDTMGEIALDLIDDALKSVKANSETLQAIEPERPCELSPKKRTNVFKYIASAAACLAVVCAVGLGVWRFGGSMTAPGGNFSDSVSEPAQSENSSNGESEPVIDGLVTILGKSFYTFSEYVELGNMGITDEQLKEIVPLLKEIKPLKTLYLNGNQITDLSPLSSFMDLERLFLENNRISDISPLGGLSKLSILNMNGNNISDITPLEGCTGLTFIGLDNNNIADITPLKGLVELDVVNLKENRITDLSPLGGLDLTSLGLGSNNISDVSPLGKIAGLENLDLSDNDITDITPLVSLMTLRTLDISDNRISDIDLKRLKESLPDCEIDFDIKAGGQVTILGENYDIETTERLVLINKDITDKQLKEIAPRLKRLTKLTTLYLTGNDISDLSPLSSLTELKNLYLNQNRISDVSPLSSLTELNSLFLDQNQISDISPLAELTELRILGLEQNKVSDLAQFREFPQLGVLYLTSNQINDITPLKELERMNELYLGDNQITDITPLNGLTELNWLVIIDNPISEIDLKLLKKSLPDCVIDWDYNDGGQVPVLGEMYSINNTELLYLRSKNITDEQLKEIAPRIKQLKNLKEIDLSGNKITDISPLAEFTGLTKINLIDNPISAADKKRLEDSLPNCSIIWDQSDNG